MSNDFRGLDELRAGLDNIPPRVKAAVNAALARVAPVIHREAIRNAPRSPSQSVFDSTRKHDKNWLAANRKKRRSAGTGAGGHSRPSPGGLERSIAFDVNSSRLEASVFMSANSEAGSPSSGQYGKRIHDDKGKKWNNRGPGTVAKGARADDKFIERAVNDNDEKTSKAIEQEMKKVKL